MEGLVSKLSDNEFIVYVNTFDFVCLVETFVSTLTATAFTSYTSYTAPARKLSGQGRSSGGVMLLVRNCLASHVKLVDISFDNIIVVELSSVLLGTEKNVFFICAYLPPADSPFYNTSDFDNGVSLLEQCILSVLEKYGDVPFILCVDFNARTAAECPLQIDTICLGAESDCVLRDNGSDTKRQSRDAVVNNYGTLLLQLCSQFDFHILNGASEGDRNGSFTFVSQQGCSVIDYFIISDSLCSMSSHMSVESRVESSHMPVTCSLQCVLDTPVAGEAEPLYIHKLQWSADHVNTFREALLSEEVGQQLSEARSLIFQSVDVAIESFSSCLKTVAACMQKRICVNKAPSPAQWFDRQCKDARSAVRKCLRTFTSSGLESDRVSYVDKRKGYKRMLRQKEKEHKSQLRRQIENNIHNPRTFWGTLKKFSCRKTQRGQISDEQWLAHFQNVFDSNQADVVDDSSGCGVGNEVEDGVHMDEQLDMDISSGEVLQAIKHLKLNKAAGPDGLIPEVFKHSSDVIVPFLVDLFNEIFSSGQYPEAWTEATIQPLHKKR